MHDIWNPWHGCKKISEGCKNCYMYYLDRYRNQDGSNIYKVSNNFDYPLHKDRKGNYKIKSGEQLRVCMTSDFFLEEADEWRKDAWEIIRQRPDVIFFILTKRPERVKENLPDWWGDGLENVFFNVTCENQKRADERLPLFNSLPIKHKIIICEPLLEEMDITKHLNPSIEEVIVGGESGENARLCDFAWVMKLRQNCIEKNIPFTFKQTGARFIKDGKLYIIKRQFQHSQAKKANINTTKR